MTISFRTPTGLTGTADTAGGISNIGWTLPTGHTTNDFLVAWAAIKPYNSTPAGPGDSYVARSGGANGTTGNGADVGSVYVIAYTKVHDGSEANPSSTMAAFYSPAMTAMQALYSSRAGSGWTVESTNGSDTTLTGTTISITGGATLNYRAGDAVLVGVGHKTDAGAVTGGAITVPGCVVGTVTQVLATTTTNSGNDGGLTVWQATITSGTASGAPSFSGTAPTSGQSDSQATFLLVREPQTVTGTVTGAAPAPSGTVTGTKAQPEAKTGTVTGVAPATSGTVVGKAARKGTVVGLAPATSGAITDTTQRFGTVAGDATAPGGTVTGATQRAGTVTGSASASGTVTGTKFEPSNDKTGTVTGAVAAPSGTTTGAKGAAGTVTGSLTGSGTVTGSEGSPGTVSGSASASGTVVGTKATTGTVAGSASASGTVTGTADYPDRTGTVTGSASASGTVTGVKATSGTVTGSANGSGTVVGTTDYPNRVGTVTGQVSASATATGTAARGSSVTGQVAATGTVTGVKFPPDAPAPTPEPSGGRYGFYDRPAPLARPIRKSGRVRGAVAAVGFADGHYGVSGTASGTVVATCTIRGTHGYRGRVRAAAPTADIQVRGTQTEPRDDEYLTLYAEVRRLRHENELLLTL